MFFGDSPGAALGLAGFPLLSHLSLPALLGRHAAVRLRGKASPAFWSCTRAHTYTRIHRHTHTRGRDPRLRNLLTEQTNSFGGASAAGPSTDGLRLQPHLGVIAAAAKAMHFHERPRGASLRPLQAGLQRPRGILPGIPAPCSPPYRLPLDFPSHLLSLKFADMTPDNRRESLRLALRPIRSRRGPATERGTFPRLFSPPVFLSLFLLFFFLLPLDLQALLVQSNSYPLHILSLPFPFPFSLLTRIASSLALSYSAATGRTGRPLLARPAVAGDRLRAT